MPLISAPSWAVGPTSVPVIPKTFHSPGNPPGGGGGSNALTDGWTVKSTFSGMSNERFYSIGDDSNNNFYAAGYDAVDDRILVASYNKDGAYKWSYYAGGTSDRLYDTAVDTNGNMVAVGYSMSTTSGSTPFPALIVKHTSAGNLVWSRALSDSSSENWLALAVTTDSNDNIYVAGRTEAQSNSGNPNPFVAKLNNAGTVQWVKKYDHGGQQSQPEGIALDSNGDIIVSGRIHEQITGGGYSAGMVFKASGTDGSIIWNKFFDDGEPVNGYHNDQFQNVAITPEDDILTCGWTNKDYAGTYYGIVLKLSGTDGSIVWQRHTNEADGTKKIAVDSAGKIYTFTDNEVLFVYASDGTLEQEWKITASGSGADAYYIEDVYIDKNDNAVLGGFFYTGGGDPAFPFITKLPATIKAGTTGDFVITAQSKGDSAGGLTPTTFTSYTANTMSGVITNGTSGLTPISVSATSTVNTVTGGQDGGYMYFDGINSYYRATGISSLIPQMETTSATIEFWFQIQQPNNSGYPSTQIAINLDDPTNSTSFGRSNHHLVLQFNMNGESGPYFRGDSQHANYYYNFDAFTNFQWYHFAYVQKYDGSNLTAAGFINGKQIKDTKNVSVTSAMSISGYNELEIGGANNTSYTGGWNTYDFTGLIHDVRFVYGTAVYDIPAVDTGLNVQRFTPPSAKLTATGGTYPSTTNVNTNIPAGHTILLTDIVGGELVDTTGNMTFTKGGNPTQIMSTGSYTPYDTLYPNRTTNGWYTNTNFTSSNPQNDVTEIKGVATGDSTNNIIIAGSDAGTDKFGMIGSYDTSTGSSNWHTQVGQNTDINNVIMKRNGGYVGHSVVCGQDFGHRYNMTPSVGLGYVGLFDTTGGSQWQRIIKPTSLVDSNDAMDIKDVAEDSSGNIWAFGESRVNGANAGNYETWHLIKMDKDGIYQSSWAYGGTTQQFARKMAIDKDDNIYLCGYIYDPTGGNNYPHGLVMKIDNTGSLTWSKIMGKNYTGVHYDQFDDIGLTELGSGDGDGLVILGGSTTHTLGNSATQSKSKPWIVALNQSNGNMVMSKISNDTDHIGVTSMFVRDNEIWCVITDRDQSPHDFLLVKYGLGANLMEKYSISYSNSNTTCRDSGTLSVDTNGNLVIGATRISGGNYRWYPTVMPADIESKKGTYGEIDIGNTTFGETNLSDVNGITNGYTYSNIVGQTTSMTIVDGFDSGSSAQPLIVATSPPYTDSGSPGNVIG